MTNTTRAFELSRLAHRASRWTSVAWLVILAGAISLPASAQTRPDGGGGASDDDVVPVSVSERQDQQGATATGRGRTATPFAGSVTPNDSFFVALKHFEDLTGACNDRGWIGKDLTTTIFAHVDSRVVNDGYVAMGSKAFWFGADAASHPEETKDWIIPAGFGGGWSQRITSPSFSLAAHPDAVLKFDALLNLRRNLNDTGLYGIPLSGGAGNTLLGVQALMRDGTWGFVHSRQFQAGGPTNWDEVPPLVGHWRVTNVYASAVDTAGGVWVVHAVANNLIRLTRTLDGPTVTIGSTGSGPGQFDMPLDVAVDAQNEIYVLDANNHRVQVFNSAGIYQREWGSFGDGPGQFNMPRVLAIDAAGNVYVADNNPGVTARVQKFDRYGAPLGEWTYPYIGGQQYGMAVGPDSNLYISEGGSSIIHVFSPAGTLLSTLGGFGSGPGQFNISGDVAFDAQGYLYVTDHLNSRVQRLGLDGTPKAAWGTHGPGFPNQFLEPGSISISRTGEIYVGDYGNSRLHRFQIGGPLAGWGTVKEEVHFGTDGNEKLPLAEPLQVRIVFQTGESGRNVNSEGGFVLPGDSGINLVDNLSLTDGATDVLPPVDFEDGSTGAWTVSAVNGAYRSSYMGATAIRESHPQTQVALQSGFDFNDPTCVWNFLSPGGYLATGTFAAIESPWIRVPRGTAKLQIRATAKLNVGDQVRFFVPSVLGKNAGDTRPAALQGSAFISYAGPGSSDLESPLERDFVALRIPEDVTVPGIFDSVKVVIQVWDLWERAKEIPFVSSRLLTDPDSRPQTRLPIFDDIAVVALGVDRDYDGVADIDDACPDVNAAGQDADGDGCPDEGASLRHVETWSAASGAIKYRLSQNGHPGITDGSDLQAVRDAFATWQNVVGTSLNLQELPVTAQTNASAVDGINLVSFEDDYQFPGNVLAITPTTSVTRRTSFNDEIVLPGQILDADIIFNPASPLSTTSGGAAGTFDLRSTAVHEIGHFLGLSHSPVPDATMNPVLLSGTEASTLAEDDQAAISAAYPDTIALASYGTIRGRVTRGGTGLPGVPIPGAMVIAWRVDGVHPDTAMASDFTEADGSYSLYRLPPGNYAVRIAPLDGTVPGVVPEAINSRVEEIAVIDFEAEWYGGPESQSDDPTVRDLLPITAGTTATADVITNIDVTPPTVAGMSPPSGAQGVRIDAPLLVTFSEPIDANSLGSAFFLRPLAGGPSLGGSGQLLTPGLTFVFVPSEPLRFDTDYQLEITPALKDRAGLAMTSSFFSTFHTELQPPVSIANVEPREAPGGAYVTLSGTGYLTTPGATNVVYFTNSANQLTAVPATLVTPTSLVAQVPADAATGPVKVVVNGQESNQFGFVLLTSSIVAPSPNGSPVALPFAPSDVAMAPDGKTAFAVGSGGLARINLDPAKPNYRVPQVSAVADVERLALTPDGLRGYMSAPDAGIVYEFDADAASATFGQVLGQTTLPGSPEGLAVSASGNRLYATDQVSERIFEIDVDRRSTAYRSLLREIAVSDAVLSGGIGFDAAGTRLFVTTLNRGVVAVDIATGAATTVNASPSHDSAILTPNGARVLAAGDDSDRSRVLYADVGSGVPPQSGSTFVGGNVRDILVHPAGGTALVLNSVLSSIQVLDVARPSPVQVASVGTGGAPVAISGSANGTVIAVANFGSESVSLYTLSDASALVRLTPATAMPGDLVAVQSNGQSLPAGTTVEVGGVSVTPLHVASGAAAFRVPTLAQGEAALALAFPNGRTLSLPLRVVDRLETHAAAATGVQLGPNPAACAGGAAGAMNVMRTSPDGSLLAVGRTGASCALLDLYRVGSDGGPFGQRLLDGLSLGAIGGVRDVAFSPDGRKVWVAGSSGGGLVEVAVDPNDLAFGSVVPFGVSQVGTGWALATDPFGRYLIVAAEPVAGTNQIQLWAPGRTLVRSVPVPGGVRSLTVSPDGRWLVAGGNGAAYFVDLDAPSSPIVTPSHGASAFVSSVAATADGSRAVGVFPGNQIAIWNLNAGAGAIGAELYFGAPLPPTTSAGQLLPAPDGNGILMSCPTCASLLKIETATLPPVVLVAPLAEPARSMARSRDGRRLFVANWDDGTLAGALKVLNLDGLATGMALVSGLDQTAQGGQALPLPVTVQVTDNVGRPQAGVLVAFALADAAQGSIEGAPAPVVVNRISDLNGQASASWTMPLTPATVNMQITALGTAIPVRTLGAESVLDDAIAFPVVLSIGPASGTTGIRAGTTVYARFSQRMDVSSLALGLTANGAVVPGDITSGDDGRVVYFTPSQPLPYGAACVFTVPEGAADLEGQVLATGGSTQFTVEPEPVLAVSTASPPAAAIGAEVTLIGEGFSEVAAQNVVRFSGVQATVLKSAATSLVVLIPPTVAPGLVGVTVEVGGISSVAVPYTVLSPDATGFETIGNVTANTGVQDLAISPDGNRVYVTSPRTNSVLAFQLKPSLFLASIPVGLLPQSIAFLPDGSKAYVANTSGDNVSVIDTDPRSPTYNKVLETGALRPPVYPVKVGHKPVDVSVSPFGPTVIVLNAGDGTLSLIEADPNDGTKDAVTSAINLGSGGTGIAITPDGSRAYVTTASGVVEVSLLSKAVTSAINLGSGGTGIAITPDGTVMFVTTEHDSLFVISITPGSASYNHVTSAINLGSGGTGIAITPDGALLYVTLPDQNAVAVFQIVTGSSGGTGGVSTIPGPAVSLVPVATLPVGNSPAGIFSDPLGQVILVANEGSGTLTILGTPPAPPPVPVVRFTLAPDKINVKLNKKTKWVTGYLEPRLPYTANQISVASLLLNGILAPDPKGGTTIADSDSNGVQDLAVKFGYADIVKLAGTGGNVVFTVTGTIASQDFSAKDTINVDYGKSTPAAAMNPIPEELEFSPVQPNPAQGEVTMTLGLPRASSVELEIFDTQGRRVRTVARGTFEAGWHRFRWSGAGDEGRRLGAGIYFARMRVEGMEFNRRIVMLR